VVRALPINTGRSVIFFPSYYTLRAMFVVLDICNVLISCLTGIAVSITQRFSIRYLWNCGVLIWEDFILYKINQYSETNEMHFLFNLLRIKGLYMWIKSASRWFHYTDIPWCTVNKTIRHKICIRIFFPNVIISTACKMMGFAINFCVDV
jgi:hypothetical protein